MIYVYISLLTFDQMLQKDVGSRPLHKAMLDHPFFASMYDSQL
jgi:hypothetical protein